MGFEQSLASILRRVVWGKSDRVQESVALLYQVVFAVINIQITASEALLACDLQGLVGLSCHALLCMSLVFCTNFVLSVET